MATPPPPNDQEARPMNDTTMPRKHTTVGTAGTTTGSSRGKQERLQKGFGLSDWMLLTKRAKDLAQRGENSGLRQGIPPEEIKLHDSVHDGWIIVHKKVYNITPYLHYHPGGVTIFKACLGKDATSLFEKYHPWVNIDGLIGVLLLGYVDNSERRRRQDDEMEEHAWYFGNKITKDDGFAMPAPRPPKVLPSMLPKDEDDDEEDDVDPLGK